MALALRLPPRAQAQAAPAAARGVARAAPHGWRNAAAKPRSRCVVVRASRSYTRHDDGSGPAGDLAVHVYPTAEAQAAALCALIERCAADAIAERGAFALAVPGGSVLKMCQGLSTARIDWSKVVMVYANHKCVELEADNSTHQKARKLFIDVCDGLTVLAPSGGADPVAEAKAYEAKMLGLSGRLPFGPGGTPVFDLMLLGMGSDGHVGSLYPGRPEPLDTSHALVLPVQKGSGPGSITLSLAVMSAARRVAIAMSGGSKADAVHTCLQQQQPPGAFPAQMVRCPAGEITWLLDAGAASKLDADNGVAALI